MWPVNRCLFNYVHLQINIIRIRSQLEYFQQYQRRVAALIGEKEAQDLVNQALVLVTLGGNDFVNNYYLVPFSARSREFALPDYVIFLISEYRKILVVYMPILLLPFYYMLHYTFFFKIFGVIYYVTLFGSLPQFLTHWSCYRQSWLNNKGEF